MSPETFESSAGLGSEWARASRKLAEAAGADAPLMAITGTARTGNRPLSRVRPGHLDLSQLRKTRRGRQGGGGVNDLFWVWAARNLLAFFLKEGISSNSLKNTLFLCNFCQL